MLSTGWAGCTRTRLAARRRLMVGPCVAVSRAAMGPLHAFAQPPAIGLTGDGLVAARPGRPGASGQSHRLRQSSALRRSLSPWLARAWKVPAVRVRGTKAPERPSSLRRQVDYPRRAAPAEGARVCSAQVKDPRATRPRRPSRTSGGGGRQRVAPAGVELRAFPRTQAASAAVSRWPGPQGWQGRGVARAAGRQNLTTPAGSRVAAWPGLGCAS